VKRSSRWHRCPSPVLTSGEQAAASADQFQRATRRGAETAAGPVARAADDSGHMRAVDRARFGALRGVAVLVMALATGDGADDQPGEKQHRSDKYIPSEDHPQTDGMANPGKLIISADHPS
jgi:hypothetical protein